MSAQFLRRRSDLAREQACREVELSVTRMAKLVLHASALADRTEAMSTADLETGRRRRERVLVLRRAAESGERAIRRIGMSAMSEPIDDQRSDVSYGGRRRSDVQR